MAFDKNGDQSVQSWPKSENVIASRVGDVLIKNTLLKADHFPGCQNTKLTPLLDGAPNFRQVDGLPVYGVAIPTVRGLRNVLDVLGAAHGQRNVLWHNMREEPVLYINGKPYVVREADQPFCNVEYTGIDRSHVEDMESRLKRDVLREAARYEQHILVTEEDDDMNVIDVWEPVTESDVQTPLEVYAELVQDGYDVDYMRVPVTDEKAPKDSDFELLIRRLWNVPADAALVFNCQMGRGRTTTGMIVATLVALRRISAFPAIATMAPACAAVAEAHCAAVTSPGRAAVATGNGTVLPVCNGTGVMAAGHGHSQQPGPAMVAASHANGQHPDAHQQELEQLLLREQPAVPAWFVRSKAFCGSSSGSLASPNTSSLNGDQKLKNGMYGVVRSLLRVLERGGYGKVILDAVIDACSAMQNLREAITTYRGRLMAESKESRRATLMGVCLEYLERYYMLIAFTSYLTWSRFDPASPHHVTFQDWMDSRPELRSILSRMLRRNPLAALELHIPAATLPPGTTNAHAGHDDPVMSLAEARVDVIVEARAGAVLGALTILKEDYFPGMKNSRLPQLLPGAGNFRRMAGPPVYGVAMCTVQGIRRVLQAVAEQQQGQHTEVLWFNMREEPVIYINGLPFVLREQQRPMKNLQEYAGIDAERLERMEARLKQDVLAEAAHYGGRILVARESAAAADGSIEMSSTGELVDMWEPISGASAVQTPAEVYEGLAQKGLAVRYLRVPVTDGRAPQAVDVDAILQQVRATGFDRPLVFNCQMGAGRTTTGTVIGGLLAMYGSSPTPAAIPVLGTPGGADGSAAAVTPAKQLLAYASTTSLSLDDLSQDILREELAGDSPRHSEDDERDSSQDALPPPALRGASVAELWSELSPEEVQERISLAGGGYVGVRRVVRLLEHGDVAKRVVDAAIDANAQMVNLRVSIMRYRRPKHQYHNHKSEVAARHSAFSRGSAYLERYCVLIAFGAYLEAEGVTSSTSFQSWVAARPELQQALGSIHTNPATALAAVPVAAVPVLYRSVRGSAQVTPQEQEQVLKKRRGKTLTRRIILKSYLARAADPALPPGTPDVRQAEGLPVFAVGNVSVDALTRLLTHLGAGPDGNTHVVVTDAREELVVYVNGVPYIRRELEMPAAALHHAGVAARQLEALEAALKEDVAMEAAKWGGRVLLHQEVAAQQALQGVTTQQSTVLQDGANPLSPASGGANGLKIKVANGTSIGAAQLPPPMVGTFLTPALGPLPPVAAQLSAALAATAAEAVAAATAAVAGQQQRRQQSSLVAAAAAPTGQVPPGLPAIVVSPAEVAGLRPISPGPGANGNSNGRGVAAIGSRPASSSQLLLGADAPGRNATGECITAPVDTRPGAAVVPFWESVDLSGILDRHAQPQQQQQEGGDTYRTDVTSAGIDSIGQPSSSNSNQGSNSSSNSGVLPSLATCLEIAKQLQAAGFHVTYRRIPLSRERTPVPGDLTDMMKQMLALPAGVGPLDAAVPGGGASPKAACMMREAAQTAAAEDTFRGSRHLAATAAAVVSGELAHSASEDHQQRSTVHLVVSRTSTGSSARFATAALATFLTKHSPSESKAAASGAPRSPTASPVAKKMRRTHSDLGEYRGVMSVARLLPGGMEVKSAVDEAIDRCSAVGNLRNDIRACKHSAEAAPQQSSEDPGSTAWAARQLGVHYLKRYFLLIAFRCYLVQRQRAEQLGRLFPDFTKWVEDRRELGHLLSNLNLDT